MATFRETIIEAVVTALSAGTPPGQVGRTNTFQRNDADSSLPAILVYPEQEKVQRLGDSDACRTLSIGVECQVKGAPPIDQALDPLLVWVCQKLLADDTLGGLVWRVQETGTMWQVETGDEDIASAKVTFDIQYATPRSDPTVQKNI
jgi:hypothetical protein